MLPDGVGESVAVGSLAVSGIDEINLIYFAVAVPVVVGEVYLVGSELTCLVHHSCGVDIIAVSVVGSVGCHLLRHVDGSYDVKLKVEESVALIVEIVVNGT